ncbi:myosin-7-like [Ostrinia furnacalis]|uniref:myosin-7-like n=1 Tax=Ostrinia furnacalis TaxID=93504 RepID=UPI00104011B3|nr:myosin-7-like [Ostrinia furnacalis]
MDIGDLSKVASRKRLNVDAEKLREKVSRETAKIIKLKVAQDTAYWDLKEKLQQVEGNHERLQQNMVEVQMQHEAISGQYQDELRLRPETLNKMSSTREICDVLEEYSERLKETLSRCKNDQSTLYDAYQKSGQLVRDIKHKQLQGDEKNRQVIERLEEKVKLTSEHQNQLLQYFSAAKQQGDAELADTKQKLAATATQKEELIAAVNELRRSLDLNQHDLQKKEESITSLQNDMKQLLHEFNLQASDMKSSMLKQEKELKEAVESNEALKKALGNQETFTKGICDQNNQLQEKISALEDENIAMTNTNKDLEAKLQAATEKNEDYKTVVAMLNETQDELRNDIAQKDQLQKSSEAEIQKLVDQLSALEVANTEVVANLTASKEDCDAKAQRIQELETQVQDMQKKLADRETELDELKASSSQQTKELSEAISSKDKELDTKASTIAQLMTELKAATDARGRLELSVQKLRKEAEMEREAASEREKRISKQVEQLEVVVRTKDDELSKQMSIILEIRAEKERLQDKIQSMQNTIDNIQKELTGRVLPSANRMPPEQDDNAVMCAPSKDLSPKLPTPQFAVPRAEPKQLDSMLFSLFSDGSMDGDTLDPSEVNRRFEALSRGERVAPTPLNSLKRRAGVPAAHGGLKYKANNNNDDLISLSQVKNDLKKQDKTFFKSKRSDPKNKKLK